MKSEPRTVLITAIGGGGHGEQILKALKNASATPYRLIGADASPHCPQFALVDQGLVDHIFHQSHFLAICSSQGC